MTRQFEAPGVPSPDPLPSWTDRAARRDIIAFVDSVTDPDSPDFVPVAERIATFDNDGTLWCEQPVPVQMYFALDRVGALADQHPEWCNLEPFASLLRGDLQGALAGGETGLLEVVMATHAGMTTTEFAQVVEQWMTSARHANTGRPYTDMIYRPMRELLAYLHTRYFKIFIVSAGGVEFMRGWAERVYGVPPEQVIGSSIRTKFELRDGRPVLTRLPELSFYNDKADKVVAIHHYIGRRPLAAFGNSAGDQHMIEYTLGGHGRRFGLLILHDDAAREHAYGPALGMPEPSLGAFPQALLDQAHGAGWTVVSMKDDWNQVFSFEPSSVTAINILLEPDATMIERAQQSNARLRAVFPPGFPLDATHRPHVTLLQRFVRTTDLERVYAAAGEVISSFDFGALRLEACRYYYMPSGPVGLAGIVAKPVPALVELQRALIEAVAPFTAATGFPEAFFTTPDDPVIDPAVIHYVAGFVPRSTGDHFKPHVTIGIGPCDYLDRMLAEPFESFTFSAAGVAVYQLGNFGTARMKLCEWPAKR